MWYIPQKANTMGEHHKLCKF